MGKVTALIAMVGLIAACGLDSENWQICLAIFAASMIWVVIWAWWTGNTVR